MGKQRYEYFYHIYFYFNVCIILDTFFDSFLFGSSEPRTSSSESSTHLSTYNTVAIQFAPKHLGLVLVSF